MFQVVIVIHLLITLSMVGIILLQRSEGGVLGMGGGGGGLMSGRSAGNLLTRLTTILAALFFITSLGLSIIASYQFKVTSILDEKITSPSVLESPLPNPKPQDKSEPSADVSADKGKPSTPTAPVNY
jgi:preprotein translocase subunit SecG